MAKDFDPAGGLSQPTPRIKCQDNEPPRPRFADGRVFEVKGPDINEIMNSWPYRGPGRADD